MIIVILISLTILLFYILWVRFVYRGFKCYQRNDKDIPVNFKAISVVIPLRNEAANLPALLNSLKNLDYPSEWFEVVLVDDHSEDGSANVIKERGDFGVVQSNGHGKKEAQRLGISMAKNAIIACTDADCEVPQTWLKDINSAMDDTTELVFGPVVFNPKESPLMALEFLALIGSTMGMLEQGLYVMGNGANMAFRKDTYLRVIDKLQDMNSPSGDDVFLLHELAKQKGVIQTISSHSTVKTSAPQTISAFINQRIRWASKGRLYTSKPTILVGLMVFSVNLWLLLLLLLTPFHFELWWIFLLLFAVKTGLDFILLRNFGIELNQRVKPVYIIVQQVINLIYIPVIAFLSLFKHYTWKGRRY